MKKSTRILSLLLALVMLFTVPTPTYAMSAKNAKAHRTFAAQLKKDKKRYCNNFQPKLKYTFADIDGDHVDELITYPGYGYLSQVIYDYQNGKIKKVAIVSQGTFTRFYRKNKIITVKNSGHMGVLYDYYMKYSSSSHKYKIVAYAQKDYGNRDYDEKPISTTYYVNNKQTSKSKYQAYIKKLSNKKDTGIKFSSLKWKRY